MAGKSLNKVQLIGNLTRDPELRYTANGTAVVNFSIATNRTYTPSGGTEPVDEVEYHNIVAWSKLAEICDKLLSKGKKVYVEGRLQTRDWTDEATNKKMYRTEIVAEDMIILSGRGDNEGGAPSRQEPSAASNDAGNGSAMGGDADFSDEIPF